MSLCEAVKVGAEGMVKRTLIHTIVFRLFLRYNLSVLGCWAHAVVGRVRRRGGGGLTGLVALLRVLESTVVAIEAALAA